MKPTVVQPLRKGQKQIQKPEQRLPLHEPSPTNRKLYLALLPLRFFLGVTFLYAGIQKLTDPGFFNPHGKTYIGQQLTAFARQSPLSGFLQHVAIPHAIIFGSLVAWGEAAIGLGTIVGILYRPAAFFGGMLSAILWLTASWAIKPYFYGADIFSLFAWTPLIIAGSGNVYVFDAALARYIRPWLQSTLGMKRSETIMSILGWERGTVPQSALNHHSRRGYATQSQTSRRDFIGGIIAGAVAMLAGVGLWQSLRPSAAATTSGAATTTGSGSSALSTTTATANNTVIANVNTLAVNSAAQFTIPSNQDPGVVVRLSQNSIVAFDATCTHSGCTVQYDQGSAILYCPCHGAEFDPKNNAAVIQGPTNQPLAPVSIAVDQSTGNIILQ